MVIPDFALFCTRQYQRPDHKVLPFPALGAACPVGRRKPYKDYKFEWHRQNSSHRFPHSRRFPALTQRRRETELYITVIERNER